MARKGRTLSCFLALLGALFSHPGWTAVDLNHATQSELEAIKGIGPAKAQAIISYRQRHGAFRRLEALSGVPGFGPASIKQLKPYLRVTAPLPPKPDPAR